MPIHASNQQSRQQIEALIGQLNHPARSRRLDVVRALRAEADAGRLQRAPVDRDVNNHIHTTYSFSPYSPSMAAFRAWQAGLATAGIMDHDAIRGADEFAQAGQILGIATTSGCELRASFAGTFLEGRHINNPDQKTVAYLAMHGVPHSQFDALDAFLTPFRTARGARNRQMTQRLQTLLAPYGITLDYEQDVLPLSMAHDGGGVTERHLLFAVGKKLLAHFGAGASLVDYLAGSLQITLTDKTRALLCDATNPYLEYDLLNVLKSELVARFFIPATDECPPISDVIKFAMGHGIILAYPYLGDVNDSITGDKKAQNFEDAFLDDLFDLLSGIGIQAVTYMPSRNTHEQLERLRRLCENHGFFQICGEDINQPRQPFVCLTMREPQFASLHDAAWALIGHERLAEQDVRNGFLSAETITRLPDLETRITHFRDEALRRQASQGTAPVVADNRTPSPVRQERRVLAFDFGASSGRAMLGRFDGETIALQEVHRFSNDPVRLMDTLHWDFLRQMFEIRQGLVKGRLAGGFDSVGIDTWGVDFGLLDEHGRLLENPVHYRDSRTRTAMSELFEIIPRETVYAQTGIQFMALNTLFQLQALRTQRPELLDRAKAMLFMPDLMAYFLTGILRTEHTIASTSQMIDAQTHEWAADILTALQLPESFFAPLCEAGTPTATLSRDLCEELDLQPVPFIRVASHDTASAVVAVPACEDDFIFISSGTWSLMGIESLRPIIDERSAAFNFTNEGGFGGRTLFMKNIMGLWLIQESRRQWIREGQEISFADMERLALASEPFRCLINVDDDSLVAPGDMPARIRSLCQATGQPIPETTGAVVRCIYESLALKYRQTKTQIESVSDRRFPAIHVVGGGTKDGLLSQFTANATGSRVIAGPIEATALGNVAVQLIAHGDIGSLAEARRIIGASFGTQVYEPNETVEWDEAYSRYTRLYS